MEIIIVASSFTALITIYLVAIIEQWFNEVDSLRHQYRMEVDRNQQEHWLKLDELKLRHRIEIRRLDATTGERAEIRAKQLAVKMSEDRVSEAETKVVYFQSRMADFLGDYANQNHRIRKWLDTLIHKSDGRPLIVVVKDPIVKMWNGPELLTSFNRRTETISLNRFAIEISIGFSESFPPELIINELTQRIRLAILKSVQNQTVVGQV